MASSEGVRRLLALAVVAAGVAAQTSVTRGVVPEPRVDFHRFGVRLLEGQLAPPTLPAAATNEPTLQRASMFEPPTLKSPAPLPAPTASAPKLVSPQLLGALPWADFAAKAETGLLDPFPNRDSVGALIKLTQNDVLVLTRQAFPSPTGSSDPAPTAATSGAM